MASRVANEIALQYDPQKPCIAVLHGQQHFRRNRFGCCSRRIDLIPGIKKLQLFIKSPCNLLNASCRDFCLIHFLENKAVNSGLFTRILTFSNK